MSGARGLAYLRADVSGRFGLGHFSRAVALAGAFERGGLRSVVLSRALDAGSEAVVKGRRAARLIAGEDEFAAVLSAEPGTHLFVDLPEDPFYAPLVPVLKALMPSYRTVSFDAFFDAELRFDLAIGPYFEGLPVPRDGVSGLRYYVFSEELRARAPGKPAWSGLRRVLVTLGGSDPFGATPAVARALAALRPSLGVTAVVGPGFAGDVAEATLALAGELPNLACAVRPPHLGELYLSHDAAVVSGGQSKFEAALFGLPGLIVSNSPQEAELGRLFASAGAAVYFGAAEALDGARLGAAFDRLRSEPGRLEAMSRRGREILDVRGGERLLEHIRQKLS